MTSIDFSPKGDQLVACLIEFNGTDRRAESSFDRTISILDYPTMEPARTLVRDRFNRHGPIKDAEAPQGYTLTEDGREQLFWFSQNQVRFTNHHVFYLNTDCEKLVHHHLASGKEAHCAHFTDGQILCYDVTDDGREVLLQAETIEVDRNRFLKGEILPTADVDFMVPKNPKGTDGIIELKPNKTVAVAWHDVLGVDAAKSLVLPLRTLDTPDRRKVDESPSPFKPNLPEDNEFYSDLPYDWQHELGLKPQKWRLVFLPPKPAGETRLAFVTSSGGLRKLKPGRKATTEPARWRGEIQDFDVSRGNCRCARILSHGVIVLSYANDALPDSVKFELPFRVNVEPLASRICLSPNGKYLAISTASSTLEIWDVENVIDPLKAARNPIVAEPKKTASLPFNNSEIVSMEFSPDDSKLLIGDDKGTISVYESKSAAMQDSVVIPNKPRGLRRRFVYGLFTVWLAVGLTCLLNRTFTHPSTEASQSASDDVLPDPNGEAFP